jgi:tetratricopeptide (TPR) repeat protein
MPQLPEVLVDRLRSGRCVLCAGAGLRALAGMPNWTGVLERLVERLARAGEPQSRVDELSQLIRQGRLFLVGGYVARRLGTVGWAAAMREVLASPDALPAPLVRLGELPLRLVVTTAADDLLERAFARDGVQPQVLTLGDGRDLRREARSRLVLKVMGDLGRPETLCWSAGDFERALAASPTHQSFGQEIVASRSLLFVGFDPEDRDFQHLFTRLFVQAEAPAHEHFMHLPGAGAIVAEEYYERYRIRILAEGTLEELIGELHAVAGAGKSHVVDEDDLEGYLHWLEVEPDAADASAGLSRILERARQAGDWERVVEVLLGRAEAAGPGAGRAGLLAEVARVFEDQIGDLPRAFTAALAAYREAAQVGDPAGAPDATSELERLASAADGWAELVAECAQLAGSTGDAARYRALGRFYLSHLPNVDYAIAAFSEARKRMPGDEEAAEGLSEALRRGERWRELCALCEERAAAAEPARRVELLLLCADVLETRTGELERAIAAYQRALEAAGARGEAAPEAAAQLERIFRRSQRFRELVELLERRAQASSDPAEARALRREIGELTGDRLGDLPGALARLEAVVGEDPRDVGALRALERLYERTGQAAQYLDTLERLVVAVQSADEKVMLLRRLAAEWEERPGGLERAAAWLQQLLELRAADEEALRNLARLERAAGRHAELVAVLERHVQVATQPEARRELWAQIGRVCEVDLGDLPRAIVAFQAAEQSGGDVLADLARLYLEAGEHQSAIEALPRLADRTADPAARVELLHTAGRVACERLNDDAEAETFLARALEVDAGHVPSLTTLAQLYARRGEWLRAAQLMGEAAERTANRLDKTRLLFEAATLHDQRLGAPARARELYGRVLALDPEHLGAASRLADFYEADGQWAELEPVLDVLARKVDRTDGAKTAEVLARLGQAALRGGHAEKAFKVYREAHEADPSAREPLTQLAHLYDARGEHAEAVRLLDTLHLEHGEALPPAERLELYFRQGESEKKRGDDEAALALYRRALEIDAFHRPSLQAVAELCAKGGQFAEVVSAKRALAEQASGEERSRLLEEVGDLTIEKLEDPVAAMTAFLEALELRPNRVLLLHKVLDLCTAQKQWPNAVELILRLTELESDPSRRAKYRYAAASILNDELADDERALELYELVLDDAPDNQPAVGNIEEIYTRRQDWKGLERAYRRMIKRLPTEGITEIRLRLWSNLGELALARLGSREVALAALEVVRSLDKNNLARREQLAELYVEAGPDHAEKAILEHQWLIRRQPDRLASYQALRKLYNQSRQFDKMWCLCAALRFLKRAEPEEVEFFEKLRPPRFTPAKRKLTEEIWNRHVVHPDEDRLVGALFTLVGPALAAWSAQPHKAFGLMRRDRTDPAQHEHLAARAFRYAVETLGIAPPELYFRPDQPTGVQVANAIDKDRGQIIPAFMVGAPLLDKPREKELVFELAKRLVFLRPERYVRYALPTPQALISALKAALKASGASNGAPVDGETARLTEHLRRVLPPPVLEQLGLVGRKLLDAKSAEELAQAASEREAAVIDLGGWLAASDLTASRAGFALVGDFEAAARLVSTEPPGLSPLAPKERLRELLVYAVSEDYFAVRHQLGIEIQP